MESKLKEKDIEKLVLDVLRYFDPKAKVDIKIGDSIEVNIESDDSGSFIGRFGQNLEALQHVIRLMANQAAGEQVSLTVDVAGYKAKKNKELEELALSIADNVVKAGYPQSLRPMNSYERRVIHSALNNFDGIEAVSVGEEPLRYIEIKPKAK
jgi:spoIIIJ-associated protein